MFPPIVFPTPKAPPSAADRFADTKRRLDRDRERLDAARESYRLKSVEFAPITSRLAIAREELRRAQSERDGKREAERDAAIFGDREVGPESVGRADIRLEHAKRVVADLEAEHRRLNVAVEAARLDVLAREAEVRDREFEIAELELEEALDESVDVLVEAVRPALEARAEALARASAASSAFTEACEDAIGLATRTALKSVNAHDGDEVRFAIVASRTEARQALKRRPELRPDTHASARAKATLEAVQRRIGQDLVEAGILGGRDLEATLRIRNSSH